jgi:uncharacterized protein (TIGR03067 family)
VAVVLPALALLVTSIPPRVTGAPHIKDREEKLQGTWKQTFSGFEGEDATAREREFLNHWVITRDSIAIYVRGAASGGWTYRLDPTKRPAEMDLTTNDGGMAHSYQCIYKLNGDELIVCLQNFADKGRPTSFDPKPGSGICKFVYARAKAGDENIIPPAGGK